MILQREDTLGFDVGECNYEREFKECFSILIEQEGIIGEFDSVGEAIGVLLSTD